MNFYHEWEARHRQEEIQRETRRKAAWNLESGRLHQGEGLWGALVQLFGAKRHAEPGEAVPTTVEASTDHAASHDHKKAS